MRSRPSTNATPPSPRSSAAWPLARSSPGLAPLTEQVFYGELDRRHELVILARSMAAMVRCQLAPRREEAIRLLEELTELQGRHDALREALRRLADEEWV